MTEELKARIAQINAGTAPAGYKKTKVGIVPEEWEVIKAKKVFRNRSDKKHDGTLEVLSVTQDRGVIPRSQVDINIKYDKESTSSYKRVYIGDFVISLRSFQGGIEYSEYNGIVSPAYTVIEAFTPICDHYYRAYFKSPTYIQRLNTAVYGIRDGKNISYEDFSQIYIPSPPLPEQQKIAEILTAQDAVIALMQKQIELLQKQKKAFLQKMFPQKGCNVPEIRFAGFTDAWEQRKLGDISDVTKLAGFEFTEHIVYSDEGNIIALRGLNVKNGQLVLDDVKYIDGSNFNKLDRSKLYVNDVLFTYVGTVGELAIIPENERFYLAPNVSRIRFKSDYDAQFMIQEIGSKSFYDHMIFPLIATSSQPALSMESIRKFVVAVPSNNIEQQQIGAFFANLDHLITLHQRKLEFEQKKKKALMQLLLTGKVRVKT